MVPGNEWMPQPRIFSLPHNGNNLSTYVHIPARSLANQGIINGSRTKHQQCSDRLCPDSTIVILQHLHQLGNRIFPALPRAQVSMCICAKEQHAPNADSPSHLHLQHKIKADSAGNIYHNVGYFSKKNEESQHESHCKNRQSKGQMGRKTDIERNRHAGSARIPIGLGGCGGRRSWRWRGGRRRRSQFAQS